MSTLDAHAVPAPAGSDILDATGTLIADVACRRCGYNLRGLHEHGRCPECSTPVGLSTYGDLLRYADPAWVEKLALGMSVILWGIVLGFVGGCLSRLAGTSGGTDAAAVRNLIAAGGQFVGIIGAWILTSPDPSGIGEDRCVNARRVVRIGLIFGLCSRLLWIIYPGVPTVSLIIVATIFDLVAAIGTYAQYLYIEKLAERVPDRNLVGLAEFLRWGYSIAIVGLALLGGIAAVWYLNQPAAGGAAPGSGVVGVPVNSTATTIGAGVCFFGLAVLVFSILCIILYIRAMKAFRQQAELARRTWACAADGPPVASPIPIGPPPQTPPDPQS